MENIIDLQKVSLNSWQVKYKGHFGIYTMMATVEENKITNFSCSCPSEHSPCKHYSIIKQLILNNLDKKPIEKKSEVSMEELLDKIPWEDLYNFFIRQANYIPQLNMAISLEFGKKTYPKEEIDPALIIRKDLKDNGIEILHQWFEKAQKRIEDKKYSEAIAICKACIEEFASWRETIGTNNLNFIDDDYQYIPFELLNRIAFNPEVDIRALFNYCKSEFTKSKYEKTYIYDYFNELLMNLAEVVNPDEFIAIQDGLLAKITDKTSTEARKILQWKLNFYRDTQQQNKEWKLIEDNLQIEIFRKKLVKKKIEEQRFKEAKQLINNIIFQYSNIYSTSWDNSLLEIALAENDIPTVRKISSKFIYNSFNLHYLPIYRSTFAPDEWAAELENLLSFCNEKDKGFSNHSADILVVENKSERLINYIEKYLWIERLEKYYPFFVSSFPEKTLELFNRGIDKYLQNNTGKNHYEYIVGLMEKMCQIENGKEMVKNMATECIKRYKSRKNLHEMLEHFI